MPREQPSKTNPSRFRRALSRLALASLFAAFIGVSSPVLAQPEPAPNGEQKPPDGPVAPAPAPGPAPAAPKDGDPPADAPPADPPSDAPLMGPAPKPGAAAPAPAPVPPAPPAPPAEPGDDDDDDDDGPISVTPTTGPLPSMAEQAGPTSEIYAEDWWNLSAPVFEIHGYYRVRAEFFHQFSLGRRDAAKPLWPQPPDNDYLDTAGDRRDVRLCGDDPDNPERCDNATQAGANMRFRINPELHISDNLRIRSQFDLLDNVVLGSTPDGYANRPSAAGGYEVVSRGGYAPTGSFVTTQWAPTSGVNSTTDSIVVKRVWGEYSTPFGQLRFGRMPSHWGLGMLVNSGDGYDSDYQSTADRLMFITGVKDWDLYFAAAWDFANEGAISAALNEQQGQPYDLAQKDDVDQWVFVVVRRMNEQLAKAALARGEAVINGGAYFVYRNQALANDGTDPASSASIGQTPNNVSAGYIARNAEAIIPDLWLQFRFEKFRFEAEAAMIYGSLTNKGDDFEIRQFGLTVQTEYRALEDRLKIELGFGYASGDDDVESIAPVGSELQPQLTGDNTYSTFRFHPDHRVDLILFRHVLNRIQGAYYLRPSVAYDFIRDVDGQRIGGGAAAIWSRASEFVQAPGHARDLGVELNVQLYFQAKDGLFNDDVNKMGGFFTSVQYGVLFPLDGLGYLPGEVSNYATFQDPGAEPLDTETAQTVRWYLGILY